MRYRHYITSVLITIGTMLLFSQANATQTWQDITATRVIRNNDDAQTVCPESLAQWRKKNCSSKTCTARWNGQWTSKTKSSIFSGEQTYYVCGTHKLERSKWKEKSLADRSLTAQEKANVCLDGNGKKVSNGWQYDDLCRDTLDMDTGHLNYVTMIDSINDPRTRQIIEQLKGGRTIAERPLEDGRYIFVLRKYANEPDRLGLVLRRYDRNQILANGQICKNDAFSYKDNLDKTLNRNIPGHVRHSQLNNGWNPVYSAGELWISDGRIVAVSNESGHFKPSKASLDYVKETLEYLSIPTNGIQFLDAKADADVLQSFKNRCLGGEVLEYNQQCR